MPIRPENRSRYPKDWALRSRFVRFSRAQNRCEWCGAQNGKPHPVTGSLVVLTTAHVYDDRPEASSLLNLAALCQKCHNAHDAKARAAGRRERTRLASGRKSYGRRQCRENDTIALASVCYQLADSGMARHGLAPRLLGKYGVLEIRRQGRHMEPLPRWYL